jgi:hypothetical protein
MSNSRPFGCIHVPGGVRGEHLRIGPGCMWKDLVLHAGRHSAPCPTHFSLCWCVTPNLLPCSPITDFAPSLHTANNVSVIQPNPYFPLLVVSLCTLHYAHLQNQQQPLTLLGILHTAIELRTSRTLGLPLHPARADTLSARHAICTPCATDTRCTHRSVTIGSFPRETKKLWMSDAK